MKRLLITALMLITASALYADQIVLKDGTILKGKIIQVTPGVVEYAPEGGVFDQVKKDVVSKIVYDDGREVIIAAVEADTIYPITGDPIKATVKQVTADSVAYVLQGTTEEKTLPRAAVERIVFRDGRTISLNKQEYRADDPTTWKKPEGGFHKSFIRFGAFAGGGTPMSGIMAKERRVFRAYEADLNMAYIIPTNYRQFTANVVGGAELDLYLPAIWFVQKRGFDLTGIKFGVKGRYGYEYFESIIVRNDYFDLPSNLNFFRGSLMQYHYWAAGPTMHLIFSPRNNIFNAMLAFFVQGGQAFNGTLNAAPALRKASMLQLRLAGGSSLTPLSPSYLYGSNGTLLLLQSSLMNRTAIRGWTVRGGLGPEFSLNRWFPVTLGVHLTYAVTWFTMDRALPIYTDGNKKFVQYELGGDVSLGVHF